MTKKIIKSSFLGILIVGVLSSFSFAQEVPRNKILDKMTYTINPAIKLVGPVFRDQGDRAEKTRYANALVSLILKEADRKAQKYFEAGDLQAYYAFMTLALTVPFHEGLFVHFRNVDGDVCNPAANNASLVKKTGETNLKIFNEYFKNPARTYFPNCEDMNITRGVSQMIRGSDGTDLSIMQVSIRWHFEDFLANRKYESVGRTLDYGFGLLISGFDAVYRNVSNYKCISESGFFFKKKKINYVNLIRGIWAGKYNSGSLAKTCRFADSSSPYKQNDIGFAKNLNQFLNYSGTISPAFVGELTVTGEADAAIREIISNFKNNKNDRMALDKILEFSDSSDEE